MPGPGAAGCGLTPATTLHCLILMLRQVVHLRPGQRYFPITSSPSLSVLKFRSSSYSTFLLFEGLAPKQGAHSQDVSSKREVLRVSRVVKSSSCEQLYIRKRKGTPASLRCSKGSFSVNPQVLPRAYSKSPDFSAYARLFCSGSGLCSFPLVSFSGNTISLCFSIF